MNREKNIPDRADTFLKTTNKEDKIAIIHDSDPDGVCSAVILSKIIERIRGRPADAHMPLQKKRITQNILNEIEHIGATKVIIADYSADQQYEELKKLSKSAEILVVDHHKVYKKINDDKITVYKPQFFSTIDPSKYCTAKLAYDAAERLGTQKGLDWIAAIACIADIATEPFTNWIQEVYKNYGIEPKDDPFETLLGKLASAITYSEVYNPKLISECYDILY
ncbi:hypothetical protein D6825_04140, partial [Candidatus Woesearchaeota archaeon]